MQPGDVYRGEQREVPTNHRLVKLFRAARQDGTNPSPDLGSYRNGESAGYDDAFAALIELVRPTYLAGHVDPNYTCGYYDGVVRALHQWLERLEADRLIPDAGVGAAESIDESVRAHPELQRLGPLASNTCVGFLNEHLREDRPAPERAQSTEAEQLASTG